jgi:hypothetical protein
MSRGKGSPPATDDIPLSAIATPFIGEIRVQCSAAAYAFKSLEARIEERRNLGREISEAIRAGGPPPLELEQKEHEAKVLRFLNTFAPILADIQGFLAATGVVASILFPSLQPRKGVSTAQLAERKKRGKELCAALGVDESSVLRVRTGGTEDARGGLFHFDEMIEEFVTQNHPKSLVTFDIGSAMGGTPMRRKAAIRWLDENSLDLWVNGRHAKLREIRKEIQRVGSHIRSDASISWVRTKEAMRDTPVPVGTAYGVNIVPKKPSY